jgi:hypothetical protein
MNNIQQNSPQYHSMALIITILIHVAFIAMFFFMEPQSDAGIGINQAKEMPHPVQSAWHPKA